jgi:hypothetical protein
MIDNSMRDIAKTALTLSLSYLSLFNGLSLNRIKIPIPEHRSSNEQQGVEEM